MATYSNTAREVEMPNGDVVVIHNAPTGGENTTSNIKKFKYDDNGHVTESTAADAEDLNLSGYSTPTTGSTDIGTSDDVQTAIGKLDHQSHIDQTNILYALGKTGRNHFNLDMSVVKNWNTGGTWNGNVYTQGGLTFTFNSDGTIDVSGTATERVNVVLDVYYPLNTEIGYRFHDLDGLVLSGCPTGGAWNKYSLSLQMTNSPWTSAAIDTGSGATINNSALPANTTFVVFYLTIYASYPTASFTFKPMFCTQEDWSIAHDYTPYRGAPNYDLTRLEAEDRAGLIECVDSGAKNLFNPNNVSSPTYGTWDASTGTFTQTNTDTKANLNLTLKARTSSSASWVDIFSNYDIATNGVVSIPFTCPVNATEFRLGHNGSVKDANMVMTGFNVKSGTQCVIQANVLNAVQASGKYSWTDIMLCTKAAFGVSPKFVPFGNDPFYQVPINHNMIYRGRNLGATLTDAQHTALSSGNFTDLYLGDYWTKTVTIPAGTYTGGDGEEVTVPAQTNITLKAVIADFDTFYAGYASTYAGINTHHAAVIVTGFSNVVWNKTNSTAGGYVASLIHKWLVGSALPQIETWFGSAKVLSHQKLLTNAITGDAASGWAWSSQKISLLSENQMYGSKVWGNSKATNGGYEPGEAFKHLNVFNHIDANLLFGNRNIWLRDIASAVGAADLGNYGRADASDASDARFAPAALILLS